MTFIVNVLHKEMSLMAADRRAIPVGPTPSTLPGLAVGTAGSGAVEDFDKFTLNQSKNMALGIAGHTHEHYYIQMIEQSVGIDEALWNIRKHMEKFLQVHDRNNLIQLTSFMENQGLASFFDRDVGEFFTNKFLFSPVHNYTRLYRCTDGAPRVLYVGSGSEHYEKAISPGEISAFTESIQHSCTVEACVQWINEVYKKVSAGDSGTGEKVDFMVSTRSTPVFQRLNFQGCT